MNELSTTQQIAVCSAVDAVLKGVENRTVVAMFEHRGLDPDLAIETAVEKMRAAVEADDEVAIRTAALLVMGTVCAGDPLIAGDEVGLGEMVRTVEMVAHAYARGATHHQRCTDLTILLTMMMDLPERAHQVRVEAAVMAAIWILAIDAQHLGTA